jgi:Immunity protein 74
MYSIAQTTPYAVFVSHEEKSLKIPGESFARGYGSPDFVIAKDAELQWSHKDGSLHKVEASERQLILQFVLDSLRGRGWDITVE